MKNTKSLAVIVVTLALAFPSMARAQGRVFSGLAPWDVHATDVADAADGDDPYDFDFFVLYDQSMESGVIQREYHCSNDRILVPQTGSDYRNTEKGAAGLAIDGNCDKGEDRIVSAREIDYERTRRRLDLLARFGIWKDLEFHVFLPIVLSDNAKLQMAGKSDRPGALPLEPHCTGGEEGTSSCSQSSVYREDAGGQPDLEHSFFRLPFSSPERAALDNPTLGVWWAPYNSERDDTEATWRLGVDYTLNAVSRMKPDEKDKVGQGYDELRLSTAFSRRFQVMNPFLEVSYSLSNLIEPSGTPFPDRDGGTDSQTLVEPGDRLAVRFGSDVVAWEDQTTGQWFALDFGGEFVYQFEGRDYTPLYSALGSSECNDVSTCELTQLAGTDPNSGLPMRTDGITDVEQFAALRGWLGFSAQAHEYVRIQARAIVAHQMAHFLTFADAGRDNGRQDEGENPRYNRGIIDPDTEEENPVFNRHTDLAGSRFRLASHLDFGFVFGAAVTF